MEESVGQFGVAIDLGARQTEARLPLGGAAAKSTSADPDMERTCVRSF